MLGRDGMSTGNIVAERPDSLTVFSYVWAAQSLIQLVYFHKWFDEGQPLGWIFASFAVLVFLFPGRIRLFAAMVVASLAYYISVWPFVVNHIFVDNIMSLAILGGLFWVFGRDLVTARHLDRADAEAWFMRFAPVCGAIFAFMYFSIIISKLNYGFFDLEISCLTGMIEEAQANRPLISGPLSLFSTEFYFWFFMVAETLLPLMLAVRRTRLLAFYFGVPFHILLGLMGHWPFSSFMLSLYALVAMPVLKELLQEIFDWLDDLRERVLRWVPGGIVVALVNAAILWTAFAFKPSWTWFAWSLILAALIMFAVLREHFRNGLFSASGVTPFWTWKPGVLWLALVIALVNSASPYVGFKTESNVAMYSNMRTEGGLNNHLFMPVVPIFGYQDDLVEIVDSNHPEILALKTHPTRYGFEGTEPEVYIPYFELRRTVSNLDAPDLEITYLRKGEERTFRKGASDNVDANLDTPLPILLAKLARFRPVFKGERAYCLH